MNVRVEDDGPCRRILHIEAPFEEIAGEYENILAAYSGATRVPGFRKGRAPGGVVERRYRKQITEDTQERVLPRLYRAALEQEKVSAVAIVGVADVHVDREQGVRFRVTVDVAPEFALPRYRKIVLKRERVEVTDEDVRTSFDRLLDRFSRFEDIGGRPVNEGDLVLIDYRGVIDGKPVEEVVPGNKGVGEAQDFWAVAGEPELLPGIGKSLVGLSIGDRKDIAVAFPDDFRLAALAGKTATYSVEIKGIRQKVLPDLDEEFLKQFDVDSEAALRDRVREDLRKAREAEERERLKGEISKYLLDKVDFDLPRAIVQEETRLTIRSMAERFARSGATREQLEQRQEEIMSAASETSTERVKLSYILNRIAEAEEIRASEEEVEERIGALAARYRMPPERFRAELEKRNGLENLRSEVRADKTMTFLLENAKIKG
jgi:trigger factor